MAAAFAIVPAYRPAWTTRDPNHTIGGCHPVAFGLKIVAAATPGGS
jgi:hypothetical protein